ncbi:MAG: rhodanese-like domain-containing protein [Chloroflexota bacterium]
MIDRARSNLPNSLQQVLSNLTMPHASPARRCGTRLVVNSIVAVRFALSVLGCSSRTTPAASRATNQDAQTQKVPVEGGGSYTDVSAAGLATMLNNKDFPLINVHVPYAGEIEPTDLFIPFDQIGSHLDKLPRDKGARIVLYCRSGSMSATAARALVKIGYTDIWNLDGGMIGWKEAGHPVVDKNR